MALAQPTLGETPDANQPCPVYAQCLTFKNWADERGTYYEEATRKACQNLAPRGQPSFFFDQPSRACYDKVGLARGAARPICKSTMSEACYNVSPRLTEKQKANGADWGSNLADSLKELWSYSNQH
ncbi:hypothetical protein Tdes44962_MAKER07784 [Teratosphaeria destructans]|uniref:Uncharacterized protein n=1 Tax=Teratosphaeria destructans TaxID=418781 RepID=A0A9W7SYC7_9PEZI|nr:hypothetical protein Tdes44962_MAKER07784 [Teratosphaeria destructans]